MPGGDREERFTRLVYQNADAVHRYLRRRHHGADATDVEDLLADVMMVAWKQLDNVPAEAELPWLYGVARRRLSNARHRSARRERIQAPMRPRDSAASAEDAAVADLALEEALSRLTDKEREVLFLSVWEGLGPSELAVALDVSVNAAAVRLSKAKTKLRSMLTEDSEESIEPVATGTSS